MIELEVNGVTVSVPKGSNLLVAAKAANIKIPTLCYHPDLKPGASCGICVVRQLVPSRTEPGNTRPERFAGRGAASDRQARAALQP